MSTPADDLRRKLRIENAVEQLVEAARYVCDWDGDPTVDKGHDRLLAALRAYEEATHDDKDTP